MDNNFVADFLRSKQKVCFKFPREKKSEHIFLNENSYNFGSGGFHKAVNPGECFAREVGSDVGKRDDE